MRPNSFVLALGGNRSPFENPCHRIELCNDDDGSKIASWDFIGSAVCSVGVGESDSCHSSTPVCRIPLAEVLRIASEMPKNAYRAFPRNCNVLFVVRSVTKAGREAAVVMHPQAVPPSIIVVVKIPTFTTDSCVSAFWEFCTRRECIDVAVKTNVLQFTKYCERDSSFIWGKFIY